MAKKTFVEVFRIPLDRRSGAPLESIVDIAPEFPHRAAVKPEGSGKKIDRSRRTEIVLAEHLVANRGVIQDI